MGRSVDDGKVRGKELTLLPVLNLQASGNDLRMPSSTDVPVLLLNQPIVLKWVGLQSFFPYEVALILLQKRFISHYFHNTCMDLLAWLLFKNWKMIVIEILSWQDQSDCVIWGATVVN